MFFHVLSIFSHFFYKIIDQYGYDAPTNHDVLLIILCLNRLKSNKKLIFSFISHKFYSICNKIYNISYFVSKTLLKLMSILRNEMHKCIFIFMFSGQFLVVVSKNHRYIFEFLEKNGDLASFLSKIMKNHKN